MTSKTPAVVLKAEPREDVHFFDDFMIVEGQGAQWRGGTLGRSNTPDAEGRPLAHAFKVHSLRNPAGRETTTR